MTDTEKAQYIFSQVGYVANNQKRGLTGLAAAVFASLDRTGKIRFMNEVVFPAYREAGSPEPYTEEMLTFVRNIFRTHGQSLEALCL